MEVVTNIVSVRTTGRNILCGVGLITGTFHLSPPLPPPPMIDKATLRQGQLVRLIWRYPGWQI